MEKKEAMKILKDFHDKSALFSVRTALDTIIPELKESEDEKMRKEIIAFIKKRDRSSCDYNYNQWIAWLEKQGEQKPGNNIEPKFHEGEWVVWNNQYYKVNYNGCGYELVDQNGLSTSLEYGTVDKSAHVFSIKDAKDGDVLCGYTKADYPWIGIFHNLNTKGNFNSYCFLQTGQYGKFCPPVENTLGTWNIENHISENVVPATKEQRDTLFAKMKEAGYTFDFEKKELKKIESKPAEWSKEDEWKFSDILALLRGGENFHYNTPDLFEWLKSLKDRVEWSEEDEHLKQKAIDFMKHPDLIKSTSILVKHTIDWLKSLKDKVQPKQWRSEEDENNILFLTSVIEECFKDKEKITLYGDTVCANFTKEDVIDWLKSLRPKKQWKPSEEQINALEWQVNHTSDGLWQHKATKELLEQIKQL